NILLKEEDGGSDLRWWGATPCMLEAICLAKKKLNVTATNKSSTKALGSSCCFSFYSIFFCFYIFGEFVTIGYNLEKY
ncbi:hypothetical protein HN51_062909, partial [Arachis hypogaea]